MAGSELSLYHTISLMADHSIATINLHFSATILSSRVRSIASNEIDDNDHLMGFLD
jgi:hypothetical protein